VALIGVRLALEDSRAILSAAQLASRMVPGAIEAGNEAAQGVKAAVRIYENVSYKIAAYKDLLKDTGAFNKTVRDVAGYAVYDLQYQFMRLDAHHLVESNWYNYRNFGAELKDVFGWKSADEMDAIALHAEWHGRSGEKLGKLGYLGAENETSLTEALRKYLREAQVGPDGKPKPFTKLSELFQAHANFYKTYSPQLWQKVEAWFNQKIQELIAAGL
jgi:hypothetical protein